MAERTRCVPPCKVSFTFFVFIISISENSFEILSKHISEVVFEISPKLVSDITSEIISETISEIMFPNLALA